MKDFTLASGAYSRPPQTSTFYYMSEFLRVENSGRAPSGGTGAGLFCACAGAVAGQGRPGAARTFLFPRGVSGHLRVDFSAGAALRASLDRARQPRAAGLHGWHSQGLGQLRVCTSRLRGSGQRPHCLLWLVVEVMPCHGSPQIQEETDSTSRWEIRQTPLIGRRWDT